MGTPTAACERRIHARKEFLRRAKTLIAKPLESNFCIYAQFDPSFAKLPNLSKPSAKPLESLLSFF